MTRCKVVQVINDGHPMPQWVPEKLAAAGIDLTVAYCWSKEDLIQHAADADIVWAYGGRRLLAGDYLDILPRCGAILRTGSGTDNVDVRHAAELGIIVANTPQVVTDCVSDHAIGLLFALVRQVCRHDRLIRSGEWNFRRALPFKRFSGASVGLVGFGRIARALVRKLNGFGMTFAACDPFVKPDQMAQYGVVSRELHAMLPEVDYLVLMCPLTSETHHLVAEATLRRMQRHALLVNVSRGAVVQEADLIRALDEGWIAGAALDVLETEPPAADNPLLKMDNVILTPHFAGYSDDYLTEYYAASVEALCDLAEGRWPYSVVNPQVTPRWGAMAPRRTG